MVGCSHKVGAFTASVLSVIGTIGNLTTICALLQVIIINVISSG